MERGKPSRIRETLSLDSMIEPMFIPNWDYKYCELARHISDWSKDPSTTVGAVTVGENGQILSQGYNGFPRGIEDSEFRLKNRELKYRYVVHAEMNCIYNASLNGVSLKNSTLFVYGLPVCSECAKGIIQVGINRVVIYTPNITIDELQGVWTESYLVSSSMFDECNIDYIWYDANSI